MNNPLVSIIVPVFNRAQVIADTLASIVEQSYGNFECLIIDDGSTDQSWQIISEYKNRDDRFRLFRRPANKIKGANSCRNIGIEKATGDYIIFFDSDDIMHQNCVEINLRVIEKSGCDYVITKTDDFLGRYDKFIRNSIDHKNYKFHLFPLSNLNYVTQRLNWLTPNLFVKRAILDNISFNENLSSGQEYNFFCKLTAMTINGEFINEVTSSRRIHENSIQGQLRENILPRLYERFKINFQTWQDLKKIKLNIVDQNSLDFLFSASVRDSLIVNLKIGIIAVFILTIELIRVTDFVTAFFYLIYQLAKSLTGRGHFIRKLFMSRWKKSAANNFESLFYSH